MGSWKSLEHMFYRRHHADVMKNLGNSKPGKTNFFGLILH